MARPIVIMHGYSDTAKDLSQWGKRLHADVRPIQYVTLSDEVTIRDIAEGFERALAEEAGLGSDEEFDALVHSTGMLVIRAWLTAYGGLLQRRSRLKHLIGLAPATFGSPLAHKGRSLIGALVKGNRHWGPDFLEAGDRVLDDLELGSRFLWDLAEQDLVGGREVYGATPDTPYPFIFVGTGTYDGWRTIVDEPGTDGTVRRAGVGFDSRKISLDLTGVPKDSWARRAAVSPWLNVAVPVRFVAGANHATILREPPEALVDQIHQALAVDDEDGYAEWQATHGDGSGPHRYQQFLFRVTDDRGDPVPDWHLQLGRLVDGVFSAFDAAVVDVHAYRADPSRRCVQIDLEKVGTDAGDLWLRLAASSGTARVTYTGVRPPPDPGTEWGWTPQDDDGAWTVILDLAGALSDKDVRFLEPFTTTLVDLRLDREPERDQVVTFARGA